MPFQTSVGYNVRKMSSNAVQRKMLAAIRKMSGAFLDPSVLQEHILTFTFDVENQKIQSNIGYTVHALNPKKGTRSFTHYFVLHSLNFELMELNMNIHTFLVRRPRCIKVKWRAFNLCNMRHAEHAAYELHS